MADDHNASMFKWRKQLCADRHLTAFDFRVAYALAERTFRGTGCATVSQALIASDVGATPRGVQKSLHRISERGHLRAEDNSKRGMVNRYWPIIRSAADERQCLETAERGTNNCSYPSDETYEQPFVPPYEQPFVPPTNSRSYQVRTGVRTEDPYRDPETCPERESPSAADVQSAFEEWWTQYPKRVAKGAARTAYERIIKKKVATVEQLKQGAMRYGASVANHDPKFVKHPATWLRGECWLDEPDKQPASSDARPATTNAGNGFAKLLRRLG
jgi:hypothetical protein